MAAFDQREPEGFETLVSLATVIIMCTVDRQHRRMVYGWSAVRGVFVTFDEQPNVPPEPFSLISALIALFHRQAERLNLLGKFKFIRLPDTEQWEFYPAEKTREELIEEVGIVARAVLAELKSGLTEISW